MPQGRPLIQVFCNDDPACPRYRVCIVVEVVDHGALALPRTDATMLTWATDALLHQSSVHDLNVVDVQSARIIREPSRITPTEPAPRERVIQLKTTKPKRKKSCRKQS